MTDLEILEALYKIDLEHRVLPHDEITPIPDFLLRRESLDLSRTTSQISKLPESIGSLVNLKSLKLSMTEISELPETIGNLGKLKNLDLGETQLSTLPQSIGNLHDLKTLRLCHTKISILPESIGNLKNLQSLNLMHTRLSELPRTIGNLENLQDLNLRRTNLCELPESIGKLKKLQNLGLSEIQLCRLPNSIGNLESLQSLSIQYIPLSSLPESIVNLENLQTLVINGSSLHEIPYYIGELKNLQTLSLNRNDISELPETIGNLKNLQYINLSETQINGLPETIGKLKYLQTIKLKETPLNKLPDSIGNLECLRELDLSYTRIRKIPDTIGNLRNLKILNLRETPLQKLPKSIGDMQELEDLDLCETQISVLPESIGRLTKLKHLKLLDLELVELPKTLLRLNLDFDNSSTYISEDLGIFIHGLKLKKQPVSMFSQSRALIEDYYIQPHIEVNESKIIFLGSEGVGKTHTIKRILNNNHKIDETLSETPGISIISKDFTTEDTFYRINFWDFGGQEIMHSMHRCFLTDRTGYVIVVSTRYGDVTSQARFWLRNLRSFAKDSPVLLFVNVWNDGTYYGIDESSLRHQFNNIIEVVHCSAKDSNDIDFSVITKAIQELALQNDSIGMRFPKTWENIRQSIISRGKTYYYINSEAYIQICNQNGVGDASIQGWLLDWFNDLGECFTYSSGEEMVFETEQSMILNPEWLTNAVYIIIRELGEDAETGIVSHKKIKSILNKSNKGTVKDISYSSEECEYVLEVMRKHMLSYKIPAREEEFIPALLKNRKNSEINEEWSNARKYELKYDYLPENVLHNLMVEYYRLIEKDRCWRNQLEISIHGMHGIEAAAVISADYDSCTILIQMKNYTETDTHNLFQALRDKIFEINQKLNLKSKDFIIVQSKDENDELERISVRRIFKLLERDVQYYEAYEKRYVIEQLLSGTFSKEVVDEAMSHKDNDDPIQTIIVTLGERKAKEYLQQRVIELLSVDDIYDYVMSACKQIQSRKKYWNVPPYQCVSEDDRNDELRDLISSRGVVVRDQSHAGQGGGGSKAGEVDLMIMRSATDPMTIIEALNLTSVNTNEIKKHLKKLMVGYNDTGLRDLFLVSYVELERSKFTSFWERYKKRLMN